MPEYKDKSSKKKGFTLIELIITIFLVSVGLIGIISFFNSNLRNQFDAKNEVIAAGLAQEGTELTRNISDYNYLNGNNWWNNLVVDSSASSTNCKSIDYTSLSSHNCILASNMQVCMESDSHYSQGDSACTGKTITDFTRNIVSIAGVEINGVSGIDLNSGDCLKVVIEVKWNGRTTTSADITCKPRE